MTYVDGFIVPVPKKKLAAYRKIAKLAGKIWMEYGALSYVECVADDVQKGKRTSFPRSVKLKPTETVVFSWITYSSRKSRDKIMGQVMKDKRLAARSPQSMQLIDSSIIRAHQHAAGGKKGARITPLAVLVED